MESKKSRKADLENKRGVFFEIGLFLTLSILLIAFEWTGSHKNDGKYQAIDKFTLEEEMIPITMQQHLVKPPPLPRQEIAEVLNIVEDELEIEDEFIMGDVEADQETEIEIQPFMDIPALEEVAEEEIFFIVEKMPKFKGEGSGAFREYIQEHVQYPPIALDNGIAGTVYVQFTIDRNGNVVDVKVIRGVDPALDNEAIRVIASSPKWTPGEQRGRPVKVRFTFPIHFVINT
jgi:protein TonB